MRVLLILLGSLSAGPALAQAFDCPLARRCEADVACVDYAPGEEGVQTRMRSDDGMATLVVTTDNGPLRLTRVAGDGPGDSYTGSDATDGAAVLFTLLPDGAYVLSAHYRGKDGLSVAHGRGTCSEIAP